MIILDVEQVTFRGGPLTKFGQPYDKSCQGKIEHDRGFHLYNIVGDWSQAELKEVIRQVKEMGRTYGWKWLRWERIRKNGHVHKFTLPLIGERINTLLEEQPHPLEPTED